MTDARLEEDLADLERRRLRSLVEMRVEEADALHEAISDIEVMVDGALAVLRYRSAIDIAVHGQEAGPLECWHLDCYRRDGEGGRWRVRWSQATSISRV